MDESYFYFEFNSDGFFLEHNNTQTVAIDTIFELSSKGAYYSKNEFQFPVLKKKETNLKANFENCSEAGESAATRSIFSDVRFPIFARNPERAMGYH